jgi:predicted transcriptional regulator
LHRFKGESIRDYIDRDETKERFKEEALSSWKVYQKTGRHLTGQEVYEWLKTWRTDKD